MCTAPRIGFTSVHPCAPYLTVSGFKRNTFWSVNSEVKYSEAQRLLGREASSNATSVTSLTSRRHRGSRSHRHGHGAGHGHGGGHGLTSRGGRRCHSCSGSWSGFLRTAAALQRQGGNEAQANGHERTGKLHDHKDWRCQILPKANAWKPLHFSRNSYSTHCQERPNQVKSGSDWSGVCTFGSE